MLLLQVVTVFLVAVALSLSLAHALEFPGKMRLNKGDYVTTQTIYYPGFTVGGLGEGLGLVATFLLLLEMPAGTAAFWWALTAFATLAAMHVVFWTVTQPVNRHWLVDTDLTRPAQRFFSVEKNANPRRGELDHWERLRDRWEYSHIVRAVSASISLVAVTIAIALYGRSVS